LKLIHPNKPFPFFFPPRGRRGPFFFFSPKLDLQGSSHHRLPLLLPPFLLVSVSTTSSPWSFFFFELADGGPRQSFFLPSGIEISRLVFLSCANELLPWQGPPFPLSPAGQVKPPGLLLSQYDKSFPPLFLPPSPNMDKRHQIFFPFPRGFDQSKEDPSPPGGERVDMNSATPSPPLPCRCNFSILFLNHDALLPFSGPQSRENPKLFPPRSECREL